MSDDTGSNHDNAVYRIPGHHVVDGMICGAMTQAENLNSIKDKLELNHQDVVSVSYPKTGSTWVNEIVFMIVNNADREKTERTEAKDKLVYIEMPHPSTPIQADVVAQMPPPRLIKSHLPLRYYQRNMDRLDAGPKVVVATRNPKDTLVSVYHFYRMNKGLGCFPGTWDEFFELFRQRALFYEDMIEYTAAWWKMRDQPNVLVVKYEDLHADTPGMIRKMSNFLERPMNDEQVQTIIEFTSFAHMEKKYHSRQTTHAFDETKSKFFRKGKVGDWRNYFNEEQSRYVDGLCRDIYAPIGLDYFYGDDAP